MVKFVTKKAWCCKRSSLVVVHYAIHNHMLSTQRSEPSWQNSLFKMLRESGDLSEISNLQPMAVLHSICKILSKLIHYRMQNNLEEGQCCDQVGFRSKLGAPPRFFTERAGCVLTVNKCGNCNRSATHSKCKCAVVAAGPAKRYSLSLHEFLAALAAPTCRGGRPRPAVGSLLAPRPALGSLVGGNSPPAPGVRAPLPARHCGRTAARRLRQPSLCRAARRLVAEGCVPTVAQEALLASCGGWALLPGSTCGPMRSGLNLLSLRQLWRFTQTITPVMQASSQGRAPPKRQPAQQQRALAITDNPSPWCGAFRKR